MRILSAAFFDEPGLGAVRTIVRGAGRYPDSYRGEPPPPVPDADRRSVMRTLAM